MLEFDTPMFTASKVPFLKRFFKAEEPVRPPPNRGALESVERLRERYPNVRSLALNLIIKHPLGEVEPTLNGRSFGPDARAYFFFKCKNVDCVRGGFDLADAIEEMVAGSATDAAGRRVCNGWESRQHVGQRRCHYELNFKAVVSYEDQT